MPDLATPRASRRLTSDVLVTFTLGEQRCGLPVDQVRDVLAPSAITPVPLSPAAVAGHLNLRGRIVTAIDPRVLLGLPRAVAARMALVTDHEGQLYALLADGVTEVLEVERSKREPLPPTLPKPWGRYATGVHRICDRLLVVLDAGRLLRVELEQTNTPK